MRLFWLPPRVDTSGSFRFLESPCRTWRALHHPLGRPLGSGSWRVLGTSRGRRHTSEECSGWAFAGIRTGAS